MEGVSGREGAGHGHTAGLSLSRVLAPLPAELCQELHPALLEPGSAGSPGSSAKPGGCRNTWLVNSAFSYGWGLRTGLALPKCLQVLGDSQRAQAAKLKGRARSRAVLCLKGPRAWGAAQLLPTFSLTVGSRWSCRGWRCSIPLPADREWVARGAVSPGSICITGRSPRATSQRCFKRPVLLPSNRAPLEAGPEAKTQFRASSAPQRAGSSMARIRNTAVGTSTLGAYRHWGAPS